MNLTVSVQPTLEPVTVDEQQSWSRITDEAESAHLEALIKGARVYVEQYLQRALMTQTLIERFDYFTGYFELQRGPVQSITSVQYIDVAGSTQTISSANYYTDLVSTPARIWPATSYTWPSTFDRPNAVTLTYVAGWSDAASVPQPIKMAISMLVDHWYENRAPFVVGQTVTEMPLTVSSLLAPWRIWQ